jgi:hypothetical protein
MRWLAALLSAVMVICFADQSAFADKRVAFIVGNSNYQNVVALANPANDAAAVTEMFKKAAFDVVESRRDLQNADMRRALRDFTEKARDADIAVIYYAGHGIEVDGTNYLVPIDAVLERDTRLRGARQMLCLCQSFILRIAALWGSLPPCRFAGKRPVIQFLTTS